MLLEYDRLMNRQFLPVEQTYTAKDSILYALGIGMARDPLNRQELAFAYEQGQKVMPSQAVVLGYPGFWMKEPDTGINWQKVLHASQSLTLHAPIPAAATVVGKTRVTKILDKGPKVGALVFSERTLIDKSSGQVLATVGLAAMARGNGGFGGPSGPSPTVITMPESTPDHICDLPTSPSQALLYRLSGDWNPLHADPDVAKAGGFDMPILHGLCTYGVVCHALLKTLCDFDTDRLKQFDVRFTSPVYPGETIRTEIWGNQGEVRFRATVPERGVVVINNGVAIIQ